MTTSLQMQPGLFGSVLGYMPKRGPKMISYPLDLRAGGTVTFDLVREIALDEMEFVQAVYVDNSLGATALNLTIAVSQQKITIAPNAQGIYTIFAPDGIPQIAATGPAALYNLLFSNMPLAPNFWKVT